MTAHEPKINIFEKLRCFLMFYLNFGFTGHWALVLLVLSNLTFLSIKIVFPGHSFFFFGKHVCLLCLKSIQTSYATYTNQ